MDIYNLSGFQWWCKQRRKASFLAIVFITFFFITFGTGITSILKTNDMNISKTDNGAIVLLIIMLIIFVIMVLSLLRTILRNFRIKVDEYWYGTITNSYIKHCGSVDNRKKRLYIAVDVNGKQMNARCMSKTYHIAQQGQQVIVFKVKGSRHLYCVHPEM